MASKRNQDAVYLVYDRFYQVIGVSAGEHQAYREFGGQEPIRVVGPVYLGVRLDWDQVQEESYGVNYGPTTDWLDLMDGVAVPDLDVSWENVRFPKRKSV